MPPHQTTYRVIYADTDNMGVAYYANYLRWFEIGRTEMFRARGLSYRGNRGQGGSCCRLSEAHCKYVAPAHYDEVLVIETTLDAGVRAGVKFDYRILGQADQRLLAEGCTTHACLNPAGKVVRPPAFLRALINPKNA